MRPDKNTVEYYPHYCEEGGKTLFILENTYGNDGYAFWFKTLSLLGRTPGHFFNVHNRHDWLFLLARTRVSEVNANNIIKLLIDLGAIDRDLWENNKVIWCQNFVDHLASLYARRKNGTIPHKPSLCKHKPSLCKQKPVSTKLTAINDSKKPQTKLKESKLKESKVKNTLCEKIHNLLKTKVTTIRPNHHYGTKESDYRTIRLMIERDKVDSDELIKLLEWYPIGERYIPEIFSTKALRDKYTQLLRAYERQNGKSGVKQHARVDETTPYIP